MLAEADLTAQERSHVAGLMRVNHTGEVCAQALYEGQALMASDTNAKASLMSGARLKSRTTWFGADLRLRELGARAESARSGVFRTLLCHGCRSRSYGDRVSLGFVEATEDQVVQHLDEHLQTLPQHDEKSRKVLEAMRADESRHGAQALVDGGQ